MMLFNIYSQAIYQERIELRYVGEVEADTPEEALEIARDDGIVAPIIEPVKERQ